ncbi:MAG TPA: toll/interleukin-1 receptor domain-containing protein [Methylocella sp.]|jgi:hypothetical protein
MPIFISYSQQDKVFVDNLARNLVTAKHNVWMDRWELSLGDSLTQRIEGALTKANAILVIVSKNSVESNWCKRELSAGLIRELEEQKTLVMPCVIDDCQIPLFLRDKLYADFRRDPDEAFSLVDSSLARVSNPLQGRSEQPTFYTDWAVDWRTDEDGDMVIHWVFVDHGHVWPYVILSQCNVLCNEVATKGLVEAQRQGTHAKFLRDVLGSIVPDLNGDSLSETISNQFEKFVAWPVKSSDGQAFRVVFTYRRMGIDNGMDTLIHLGNYLTIALAQMTDKLFAPNTSDRPPLTGPL